MGWLIVLCVVALPVVEIALFVKSAQAIGGVATVVTAVLAGMLGLAILRAQGVAALWRMRSRLADGDLPLAEAFDAACLTVAGILLVLPGLLTDALGLLLLVPPVRHLVRLALLRRLGRSTVPARPGVIEGEYRVINSERD